MKTAQAIRQHNQKSVELPADQLSELTADIDAAWGARPAPESQLPEIVVTFREINESLGEAPPEPPPARSSTPPEETTLDGGQPGHDTLANDTLAHDTLAHDTPAPTPQLGPAETVTPVGAVQQPAAEPTVTHREEDLLNVLLDEINTAFPDSVLSTEPAVEADASSPDSSQDGHSASIPAESHIERGNTSPSPAEIAGQILLSDGEVERLRAACLSAAELAERDVESTTRQDLQDKPSESVTGSQAATAGQRQIDEVDPRRAPSTVASVPPEPEVINEQTEELTPEREPKTAPESSLAAVTEGAEEVSAFTARSAEASATATTDADEPTVGAGLDQAPAPERIERLLEQYRELVAAVLERTPAVRSPVMLFAAADLAATTSICVQGLAEELADREDEQRVLLIDGRLTTKTLSSQFGLESASGLADALLGDESWQESIRSTDLPQLDFLPAGQGLLTFARARAEELIRLSDAWKAHYDYILIDGGDPQEPMPRILAPYSDATYLLVTLGETETATAKASVRDLRAAGARLLGSIVCAES